VILHLLNDSEQIIHSVIANKPFDYLIICVSVTFIITSLKSSISLYILLILIKLYINLIFINLSIIFFLIKHIQTTKRIKNISYIKKTNKTDRMMNRIPTLINHEE
jgi:hypothetical protein